MHKIIKITLLKKVIVFLAQVCKNIPKGSKSCFRLAYKASNMQNCQNINFNKSYGFYTGMQKHNRRPKRYFKFALRALKV